MEVVVNQYTYEVIEEIFFFHFCPMSGRGHEYDGFFWIEKAAQGDKLMIKIEKIFPSISMNTYSRTFVHSHWSMTNSSYLVI